MNPASNLYLIGPMGAGKTTIGRRAASLLGLPFFDLDHEIEKRCGAAIALIFDIEGEAGFRQRESALLAEFAARSGIALATGGGAVLAEDNRRLLHETGFVVFLQTTVDEQLRRLSRDRKRPLLNAADRRERLQSLATRRDPLYAQIADYTVPAGHAGSTARIAARLASALKQRWRQPSPVETPHE